MSDTVDLLQFASREQRRATAPAHSSWVEANAGTGKTKVLTDRVTRLLLAGTRPERILCLTFTKAAAAEMRNRLAGQLGRWAMADEAMLDHEIEALIDRPPEQEERTIARRLFARVLDAPGGINILTIHAFCQSLLKRFPLEAGVAPGFEVLDEAEATAILRHAQDEQLAALARDEAPADLRDALAAVAGRVSATEYAELMTRLLGERAWLLARIADEVGLRRVRRRLARTLECDKPLAISPDESALRAAAHALHQGRQVRRRARPGDRSVARRPTIGRPCSMSIARYSSPTKASVLARLATKAAVTAQCRASKACYLPRPNAWAARSITPAACALVDLTMALLRLGLDITRRYDAAKRRRAALDYDDLIVATRRLLESAESAAWVLYKLDGGIDHVLVDEAQDTNPDQWEVIRRLTEEFFVGQGAVDRNRTVFAVGDTKQSIFGFQRADPRKLAEMRLWFEEQSQRVSKPFVPVGAHCLLPLDARRPRCRRLGVQRRRHRAWRRRGGLRRQA